MKVDAFSTTPSVLSTLSPNELPACLKTIITVGEPLNNNLVDLWADRVELRVSYGLSECAQLNCSRVLKRGDNPHRLDPPSDFTKAYIFNPDMAIEVTPGTVGELCLGGPQVSQGYLKRAKENKAAFFTHPSDGIRLYRTGDLALKHLDSSLEIVGRLDFQLKINGQRLEPGEIAQVLLQSTKVESVTIMGANIRGRVSLVAIIVPKSGADWELLKLELFHLAQTKLPSYMLPAYWANFEKYPVTSNGKLNLSQIRQVVESTEPERMLLSSIRKSSSELVTDAVEIAVRESWAKVLQMTPTNISPLSSFVALGGTSMDAIMVVRDLRSKGFIAELGDIFRSQNLRNTKVVRTTDTIPTHLKTTLPQFPLIKDNNVKEFLKVKEGIVDGHKATPLQEGMLASTLQGNKNYVYQRTFDVRHLDLTKLKLAFQIAFSRSDVLQSSFVSTEWGIFQTIHNNFSLPWTESSLSLKDFKSQDRETGVQMEKPHVRFTILNRQILVVSIHHALFDFWSHNFLFEDVARLYNGDGQIHRLPFRTFVQFLQTQDYTAADAFWKSYLNGAEPTILIGKPAPKMRQKYQCCKYIQKEVVTTLGVTLGTAVYTAWAIVLSRHTSSKEAVFAITVSGRELPIEGIETMDGPAMSVIPQRLVVDPSRTLRETLQENHARFWTTIKHSQTGLRKALSTSNLQNARLFDTLVNFRVKNSANNYPTEKIFKLYGQRPVWQTEYTTLDIEEDENGLHFTLVSPTNELQLGFILDEFLNALSGLLDIRSEGILNSSMKILSETENRFLSNMSHYEYVEPRSLHSRFELIAQKYPERIAIQWQLLESISYQQLDCRANQLSNYLANHGFKSGDLIPLLLNKFPTMIIAILAVLKLGAAYVPLSPDNPLERNLHILHEMKVKSVLTQAMYTSYFPVYEATSISLDEIDISTYSTNKPPIQVLPSQLAYLIYTSGSTGQPKGVMIEHQSAASAIDSIIQFEGRADHVFRTLQFSNYVFDVSVYDIFVALGSGHTLCLAPSNRLLSELDVVINEMQVSHCFLTPTVARLLKPESVPSLKVLCVGGESVTADIINTWAEGHILMNGYGPTEASILVTMRYIKSGDNPRNIGTPLPTVRGYILEREYDQLAPYGAIGELCFSGQQVARGYYYRPDLTEAAFGNSTVISDRIYRTGDLARWLENGEIECLGRKDNQVKINGYRVELGEIEQTILRASSVKDVAAMIVEINNKPQLVAIAVLGTSTETDILSHKHFPDELREIKDTLTGLTPYMKPKAVIPIGSMPKLPSGKVDKKQLKRTAEHLTSTRLLEFLLDSENTKVPVVLAETKEQRFLVQAWSKILNLDADQLGLQSRFFSLGGDSIAAIDLVSHVRKHNYLLSVGDVIRSATLGEMASILQFKNPNEILAVQAKFEPPTKLYETIRNLGTTVDSVEYIYPSPPGQAEFLTQGAREEQFWTLMTIRALPRRTNVQSWIQTVEHLTRENDILRTTFVKHKGAWFGIVLKSATPLVDYFPISSQEEKAQVIDKIWKSRFKFGGAFIRYCIFCFADNSYEVLIKMDHALYDGTLLRIFASHFKSLQHSIAIPSYTSFHSFALHNWQNSKARALEYFTSPNRRPTASKYPPIVSRNYQATINASTTLPITIQKLDLFSKTSGVTIPIIFQAAFQIWLARSNQSLDIEYDYLYTGRNIDLPDPQSINGPCANFLPLRVQLTGKEQLEVAEYLADTQAEFWMTTEHGNVGLDDIYKACGDGNGDRDDADDNDHEYGKTNTAGSSSGGRREMLSNTALFLFQPFEPSSSPILPKKKQQYKSEEKTIRHEDGDNKDMEWLVMAKSQVTMPLNYAIVFEIVKTAETEKFTIKLGYDGNLFGKEDGQQIVHELENIVKRMVGGQGGATTKSESSAKVGDLFVLGG